MKADKKREQEKEVVKLMVEIYCRGHKHGHSVPCPDCQSLIDYAAARLDLCPFMEDKTFCSACPVHCYEDQMRAKIKEVMRYSGPRMLLHRPLMAIRHLFASGRVQ